MITEMEARVRERIHEGLFGVDQDTLEEAMLRALRDRGFSAVMIECGIGGALRAKAERVRFPEENVRVVSEPCSMEELRSALTGLQQEHNTEAALGLSLTHTSEKHILSLFIISPEGSFETTRSYGGERALSAPWAVNTGIELLRRALTGELTR